MPKELYEEALADIKRVREVAENSAKQALLEAVTPRIREFIDQALLGEHAEDGDPAPAVPGGAPLEGELLTDLTATDPEAAVPADAAGSAAAITPPDAEGKVTLDIDALACSEPGTPVAPPMFGAVVPAREENEYEINLEAFDASRPIASKTGKKVVLKTKDVSSYINKLSEQTVLFKRASRAVRSTPAYRDQIAQMISRVENMYDYVQEQVADPARQTEFNTLLEANYKALTNLQESMAMSKQTNKSQMNEADVTLKLTGLPDDIELDDIGVDLISGEDEEGEMGDMEGGDDADFGGDSDLDLGGQGGQEQQMETRRLSDDTIVEIDEKMLRREIARMRNIRENHTATGGSETKAQSWGNGADHFDSFGGGKDEGEPTEADIVDKSPAKGALPLGEADEDLDEQQAQMDEAQDDLDEGDQDDLDEGDYMDEAVDGPAHGGNETMPTNKQSRHPGESFSVSEGKRRLAFEKNLQDKMQSRAKSLKEAYTKARGPKAAQIKKEYALVAKRFNESVKRSQKMTQLVAEAAKVQKARSNSDAQKTAGVDSLRKKLAETNLFNAKLVYTNKLLQNESLTARQKAQVIKQLDEAKTTREAKLVYDSLLNTLGNTSKTVTESKDRTVLGSGSRPTRPASTQTLNEGYEAERWATLAGITKR